MCDLYEQNMIICCVSTVTLNVFALRKQSLKSIHVVYTLILVGLETVFLEKYALCAAAVN
jgi:hypothetical protein